MGGSFKTLCKCSASPGDLKLTSFLRMLALLRSGSNSTGLFINPVFFLINEGSSGFNFTFFIAPPSSSSTSLNFTFFFSFDVSSVFHR